MVSTRVPELERTREKQRGRERKRKKLRGRERQRSRSTLVQEFFSFEGVVDSVLSPATARTCAFGCLLDIYGFHAQKGSTCLLAGRQPGMVC